mmetsp:Transcript_46229/g.128779  ORF Transcript_46229/g.128779 Transcript_46229/m.128779 type:complete len:300 (-) Transcript_46229:16-915(-)
MSERISKKLAMSTWPLSQFSRTSGGRAETGTGVTETEDTSTMLSPADSQKAAQMADAFWERLAMRPDTATCWQEEKSQRDLSAASVCPPDSLVRHCPIPPALMVSGGASEASVWHQCRSQSLCDPDADGGGASHARHEVGGFGPRPSFSVLTNISIILATSRWLWPSGKKSGTPAATSALRPVKMLQTSTDRAKTTTTAMGRRSTHCTTYRRSRLPLPSRCGGRGAGLPASGSGSTAGSCVGLVPPAGMSTRLGKNGTTADSFAFCRSARWCARFACHAMSGGMYRTSSRKAIITQSPR